MGRRWRLWGHEEASESRARGGGEGEVVMVSGKWDGARLHGDREELLGSSPAFHCLREAHPFQLPREGA